MKVNNKYTKILEIKVGSHLYGTNTPSSDIDYSGIVLPFETEVFGFEKMEEICLNVVSKDEAGKNTSDAVDRKYYEFRKFCHLASECNPNVLEQLFVNSENIIYISPEGKDLLDRRFLFLSKESINTKFLAYSRSQKKKMTIKPENYESLKDVLSFLYYYLGTDTIVNLSNEEAISKSRQLFIELRKEIDDKKLPVEFKDSFIKIGDININKNLNVKNVIQSIDSRLKSAGSRKELWEKYGYDTKFGMNLIRLLLQGKELLETGNLIFPLADRDFLLDIKTGKYTLNEVLDFAEVIESEFDKVYHSSNMQSKSNYNEIQNFVICTLKNYFKNREVVE